MLSFAHVMHFFTHELAGLCRRRFPFPLILFCPVERLFLRHDLLQNR